MSEPGYTESENDGLAEIRRDFEMQIVSSIGDAKVIDLPPDHAIPNVTLISFHNANGEMIAALLAERGAGVSTGSRCGGNGIPLLSELNVPYSEVMGTVRFTLTSKTDAAELVRVVTESVSLARSFS